MSTSPVLGLTLMSASQAQKEAVFNNFLIAMDALFRGSVLSAALNTPPGSPSEGDAYVVAASPTGAWSGQANSITFYFNGWQFITPPDQCLLYDVATSSNIRYSTSTSSWSAVAASTVSVLDDLSNVQGSPSNGQVLTYNSGAGKWEPANASFTATLASLTDVEVTEGSGINGYALVWNQSAGKWEAASVLSTKPAVLSLPDVTVPGGVADGWVATYGSGPGLTFVNPTSIITVSTLSQVGDVSYGGGLTTGDVLTWNGATWGPATYVNTYSFLGMTDGPGTFSGHAHDILRVNSVESALEYVTPATALNLSLASLTDVEVTTGSGIDGEVLYWNNAASKWEVKALATVATSGSYADLSSKPTIPTNSSFDLASLGDVNITTGSGVDGYIVYWNNAASRFELKAAGGGTLTSMTDVNVAEGSGIDGYVLYWHNADGKWEAKALATVATSGAYADLTGRPTIPTNAGFFLGSLGDVSVSLGTGVDGYVLYWNNGASRFELKAAGGGTLATLTDVNVTEGSGIDGQYLKWNNSTSKWVASAVSATTSLSALTDVSVTEGSGIDGYALYWHNTDSKWEAKAFPAGALASLSDVSITTGSGVDGYSVVWNNTAGKFELSNVSGGGGGGSSTLAGDTDVAISSPTDGQVLTYSAGSSKWINATPSGGGGSGTLSGDSDVQITSVADGQVLQFNATDSKWENVTLPTGGALLGPSREAGPFAPPDPSWFTGVCDGSQTCAAVSHDGIGTLFTLNAATTSDTNALFGKDCSAWGSTWAMTARLIPGQYLGEYPGPALFVQDSTGKYVTIRTEYQGNGQCNVIVQYWNSLNSYNTNKVNYESMRAPEWFRIRLASSTLYFGVSANGLDFLEYSISATDFIGTPVTAGIMQNGNANNSTPPFQNTSTGALCTYYDDPDHPATASTVGTLATFNSLADVNITEGAGIDGMVPVWHQATGKWIAQDLTDTVTVSPPTIVQSKAFCQDDAPYVLDSAPTAGNLLVALLGTWHNGGLQPGWSRPANTSASGDFANICVKLVPPGDTTSQSPMSGNGGSGCVIFEIAGADPTTPLGLSTLVDHNSTTTTMTLGAVKGSIILGAFTTTSSTGLPTISGTGVNAGPTATAASGSGGGYGRSAAGFYQAFTTSGSGLSATATYGSSEDTNGYVVMLLGTPIPATGSKTLAGDADVAITGTPVNNQYLAWNSVAGYWVNQSAPLNIAVSITGLMVGSEKLLTFIFPYAAKFSAGLSGSFAKADVGATASTVVTITKNGTSIGTLTWAASGTTATISFTAEVSFAAGDKLQLIAPSSADATLSDIGISLLGYRT